MLYIVDGKQPPICPLCDKRMEFMHVMYDKYYTCHHCEVCVKTDDPYIKFWNEPRGEEEEVPCQICGKTMRFFIRSDGFFKLYCPKCKVAVAMGEEKD